MCCSVHTVTGRTVTLTVDTICGTALGRHAKKNKRIKNKNAEIKYIKHVPIYGLSTCAEQGGDLRESPLIFLRALVHVFGREAVHSLAARPLRNYFSYADNQKNIDVFIKCGAAGMAGGSRVRLSGLSASGGKGKSGRRPFVFSLRVRACILWGDVSL